MAGTNAKLQGLEAQLRAELPELGPRLLDFLTRAELPFTHLRRPGGPHGQSVWLIQTEPAEHLTQSFGLAPALLVLLVPGTQTLARDIERAEEAIQGSLRLDAGVVLVFGNDCKAQGRLAPVIQRTGRQYLFLEIDRVRDTIDPRGWLKDELRRQLGSADLFASGRPVVGWDFFGRAKEIKLLQQYLRAGKPVGLYGLRKVGKTSLALRTLAQLVAETDTLALHLDMQGLGPRDRSLAGFMRAVLRAIDEGLRRRGCPPASLGLEPDFGAATQLRLLSDEQAEVHGFRAIEATIDWARQEPGRSVVMFIDEYERLFEADLFPAAAAQSILDYLRGQVQLYPGFFNFLVAGLTRRFAAQPRLGRHQNPLFGFLIDFPLAGLGRTELNELFRKIGRRVGVQFEAAALAFIYEQSGGHAAIAREYGRIANQHVSVDERLAGVRVSLERLLGHYGEFRLNVEPTMREVYDAVNSIDARAPESLAALVAHPGMSLSLSLSPQSIDELCRLGVITMTEGLDSVIAIGCFSDWLSDNVATRIAAGA